MKGFTKRRIWAGRKTVIICFVGIIILGLCGCSKEDTTRLLERESKELVEQENSGRINEYEHRSPIGLLQTSWVSAQETTKAERYWRVEDYQRGVITDTDGIENSFTWNFSDSCDFYHAISRYNDETRKSQVTVNKLNIDTMECTSFVIDQNNIDGIDGYSASGGVLKGFYQEIDEKNGETLHYYVMTIEEDGTVKDKVDLYPGLESVGLKPESYSLITTGIWDHRGYFYFWDDQRENIYVFDQLGELLTTISGVEMGENTLEVYCKTMEGDILFSSYNKATGESSIFLFQEDGLKVIVKEKGTYSFYRCANSFGEIFEMNGSKVITRYQVENGKRETCFLSAYMEDGLCDMMANSAGKIFLFYEDADGVNMSIISSAGPLREEKIKVFSYYIVDVYFNALLREYERMHPGITFQVEESKYTDKEEAWKKLSAEMLSGEGPDLVFLPLELIDSMVKKDMAEPLESVLTPEIEENVFNGIWEKQRESEHVYFLPFEVSFDAVLVPKDIWNKDRWTLGDVVTLLKKSEKEEKPFYSLCLATVRNYDISQLGYYMFDFLMTDIANSPFVDWDKKETYFEQEDFIYLLEYCKKYGVNEQEDSDNISYNYKKIDQERTRALQKEKVLSLEMGNDFSSFSQDMAVVGQDFHIMGIPTDQENGIFWNIDSEFAVNKNSPYKESLKEMLGSIYSFKMQMANGRDLVCLRKDVLSNCVKDAGYYDWTDSIVMSFGNGVYRECAGKPDGSSYIDEYLDVLESAKLSDIRNNALRKIILEEADAYFCSDKSAEETARIIQSRARILVAE